MQAQSYAKPSARRQRIARACGTDRPRTTSCQRGNGTTPTVDVIQGIAWDCGIRPNEVRNGVYLRNYTRHETKPGYRDLFPAQKFRMYHPGIHTDEYIINVGQRLEKGFDKKGKCKRDVFRQKLQGIKVKLLEGTFPIHHRETG
jgi:hypothetical protein